MYTHQQINDLFKDLATRHLQIHSYGIGALDELGTDTLRLYVDGEYKSQPVYPLMWAVPVDTTIEDKITKLRYDILFMDLVDDDLTNEQDVLNDTLLIGQDIWNELTNPAYRDNFVLDRNTATMKPFRQRFKDNVAGWTLQATLKLDNLRDRCAIPFLSGGIGTSGTVATTGTDCHCSFLTLSDTPNSYSGFSGFVPVVNDDEDGLEFIELPTGGGSGVTNFLDLTDTPDVYTGSGGLAVVVNGAENALEFVAFPTSGATTFLQLTDTPNDYSGFAGYVPMVNGAENALIFVQINPGDGTNDPLEVQAMTLVALPAFTYNGIGGIGDTITFNATGVHPSIDGVAPFLGMTWLNKNGTGADELYNGVYIISTLGGIGINAVSTRTTNADEPDDLDPQIVIAVDGTQANKPYTQQTSKPVIETDNIVYKAGFVKTANWALDGNTEGTERWFGTKDNFRVPVRTNNIERAYFPAAGGLVINTTDPAVGVLHARGTNAARNTIAVHIESSTELNSFQVRNDTSLFRFGNLYSVQDDDNRNTSWGRNALQVADAANAFYNTAIGDSCMILLDDGISNSGLGLGCFPVLRDGSLNSALGKDSGLLIQDANFSTFLGGGTGGNFSYGTAIGVSATLTADNQLAIGSATAHMDWIKQVYSTGGGIHQTFYLEASPENSKTGNPGDEAWVRAGTTGLVYIKQSGVGTNTGWVEITGGGGGGGSVTSFSAGDLSPLFTTSEADPTTTPALTFTAVNQNANLVYAGPTSGGAAAPTFRSLVALDIPDISATYLTVVSAASTYQPLDSDLTAIAALTTDAFGRGLLPLTTAAAVRTYIGAGTGNGNGDALVANPLSQFAATTSLQLKGVISDETGSGALVFADTPTLITPVLGVATATSVNKITITIPATGATLTIDDGFTLHATGNVTALSGSHTGTSSGTNTGDQTSIVGITGTKAQFDTAVTDGNFLYVGDITQYTDELAQDAIGAMVDGSLVYVDATPLLTRAALTGDVTASQGSNATTIANDAVTNAKAANMAQSTIKGRAAGAGTGDPTDLTPAEVRTVISSAYLFNKSITDVAHTGNTNETKVYSVLMPANTLVAGNILRPRIRVKHTGTGGAFTFRTRFGTADDLTGAICSVNTPGNTVLFSQTSRNMFVKTTATFEVLPISVVNAYDDDAISTTAISTVTVDTTVANYFVISVQLANSADTATFSGATIEIL